MDLGASLNHFEGQLGSIGELPGNSTWQGFLDTLRGNLNVTNVWMLQQWWQVHRQNSMEWCHCCLVKCTSISLLYCPVHLGPGGCTWWILAYVSYCPSVHCKALALAGSAANMLSGIACQARQQCQRYIDVYTAPVISPNGVRSEIRWPQSHAPQTTRS